jgi:hypothetical protein
MEQMAENGQDRGLCGAKELAEEGDLEGCLLELGFRVVGDGSPASLRSSALDALAAMSANKEDPEHDEADLLRHARAERVRVLTLALEQHDELVSRVISSQR